MSRRLIFGFGVSGCGRHAPFYGSRARTRMPLCLRPRSAPRPDSTGSATSERVLRFGDSATTVRSRGLSAHHRTTAGAALAD